MRTLSIRSRLALWYAAVYAPLLAALSLAAYWFMAYSSQERVDEFLAESSATVAAALEFERSQGVGDSAALQSVVGAMRLPDVALHVVQRGTGRELTSMEGLRYRRTVRPSLERDLRVALAEAAKRAPSEPSLRSVTVGSADVRVLTMPYTAGRQALLIAVAQVMTARTRLLRDARVAVGVGLPLVLLVASLGGWWLAGKSLAPVDEMTRRARLIGATNLHERLPAPERADELGRLATVINELLERLENAFDTQARFAADASHELRTPVAVISGEAELALSSEARSRSQLADALRVIRAESLRLRAIVDDLFFLARADAGERMVRDVPLHLRDLVEDSVRAARSLAAARQVAVHLDPAPEAPVRGDEVLLRRAIDNLLVNAIKYSPAGSTVTVQVTESGDHWSVLVIDQGPGIAREDRGRLFERFFRAAGARASASDGSGLGLAITRSIARAHGGDADLVQTSSAGSVFRLRLPDGSDPGGALARGDRHPAPHRTPSPPTSHASSL